MLKNPLDYKYSCHSEIEVRLTKTELTYLVFIFQVCVMHSRMKWSRVRTRKLYW